MGELWRDASDPTFVEAPMPHTRLTPSTAIDPHRHCLHPRLPPSRSLVVPDTARTVPLNMSAIGSVFLGDVQRHRVLSSSTPPSSPPPHLGTNAAHSFSDLDDADEHKSPEAKPPSISPMLSLELRLRWLETLLLGAKHDELAAKPGARADKLKDGETIARRVEDLQRRLDGIALSNDALKRFMDRCEFPTFSLICARVGLCVRTTATRSHASDKLHEQRNDRSTGPILCPES